MEVDDARSKDSTYSESSEPGHSSSDISEALHELIRTKELEEENSILKKANTRLRHNMELLRQRLRYQAIEHERELNLTAFIDNRLRSFRPTWKPLPTEVLHSITLFTLPPDYLLKHSSRQGFYTSWCKVMDMKLSLIRVNKAWYHAALPLLYGNVIFRHVGPIAAFLETLRATSNTSNLAALVKSVHTNCLVPPGFESFVRDALLQIHSTCPSISVLGSTTFDHAVSLHPLSAFPLTDLSLGPPSIFFRGRTTESNACYLASYVNLMKHLSASLQSLDLHLWHWVDVDNYIYESFPQLCFPSLKQFPVRIYNKANWHDQRPGDMDIITTNWRFPVLERFTYPAHSGDWLSDIDNFLTHHGAFLKYLQLDPFDFCSPGPHRLDYSDTKLQQVLDACPLLEHLVVTTELSDSIALRHPHLKYLDIWQVATAGRTSLRWHRNKLQWGQGLLMPSKACKTEEAGYMQSNLPQLEGVRSVDHLLRPLRNLLIHLKPLPVNSEPYEIDLHGLTLRHEVGALFVADDEHRFSDDRYDSYVKEHFQAYDPDSDEEPLVDMIVNNNLEEGSDASWDSDEIIAENEVLQMDPEDLPEDRPVDVETVLGMYRETLASTS